MVDFQRLLDQAAAPVAPVSGVDTSPVLNNPYYQKEQQLAQAAAEKKNILAMGNQPNPMSGIPDFYSIAAGMGNQHGAASMGPLEQDLRTMQPLDLYLKYGSSAIDLLNNAATGGTQYFQDTLQRNNRSGGEVLGDSLSGVGAGFLGGIGGLASLGVGLVDEESGTWLGNQVQDGMQWVEEQQSEGVNAARRIQRTKSALDQRDNTQLRQQEIDAGSSELMADLRRWGRDVVDTFSNSATDPVMFGQGTSEAVGSLLVGGPIAKGLKAIGAPVAKA